MFRTKLTRLFQIVLLSGMLFSHIEIASAQSTGGGQALKEMVQKLHQLIIIQQEIVMVVVVVVRQVVARLHQKLVLLVVGVIPATILD